MHLRDLTAVPTVVSDIVTLTRKVMTAMTQLITPVVTEEESPEKKVAHVLDLVRHAIRKSGIDAHGLQRIIEQGGVFQARIIPILQELALPWTNEFADELTKLGYSYPQGWSPDPLDVQRDRLLAAFPGLKLPDPIKGDLPTGFDVLGYHIFPERLGLRHGISDCNGASYGHLIQEVVFPKLAEVYKANGRGFENYRAGELGSDYIRLELRGRVALEAIQAVTEYDAYIAPVSYGKRWAPNTLSPRNARETALLAKELAQGSAQVGCHLIAQPGRLVAYEDLFLDCSGDEYNWDAGGGWSSCPGFYFRDGALRFSADWAEDADEYYGSVVALSPGVPVSGL